jgi:hypothetical protein
METVVSRFFDHPGQIVALAAVFGVWILLHGVGALIGGRDRIDALDGLLGWAAVCAAFTVFGAFTPVPFYALAAAIAVAGGVGLIVARRRDGRALPAGFWPICLVSAPLLLAASAMVGSQWDEFSHWLPSISFLLETHAFPNAATMDATGASYPAYPYGWTFLPYLAGLVAFGPVDSAGGLFNLLILFSLALLILRVTRIVAGDPSPWRPAGWGMIALGALAVTILNPTFHQKVVLTAYADASTAACVAAAAILGCLAMTAEARGDAARATRRMVHAGLILMILVTLKQATFALFGLVVGAVVLVGLVDRAVGWRRTGVLGLILTAPGLAVYLVWRHYVNAELAGAEFAFPPMEDWQLGLIPAVLERMALIAANKGGYFVTMLIACALAVLALVRCTTLFDRITLACAAVFVGYNAFLLFAYVTVFGEYNAVRAMSYWRYNMHVGGLSVAFLAVCAGALWRRYASGRSLPVVVTAIPVVLMLALPVALSRKIRFDHEPDKPHFRAVASALLTTVADGADGPCRRPQGNRRIGADDPTHPARPWGACGLSGVRPESDGGKHRLRDRPDAARLRPDPFRDRCGDGGLRPAAGAQDIVSDTPRRRRRLVNRRTLALSAGPALIRYRLSGGGGAPDPGSANCAAARSRLTATMASTADRSPPRAAAALRSMNIDKLSNRAFTVSGRVFAGAVTSAWISVQRRRLKSTASCIASTPAAFPAASPRSRAAFENACPSAMRPPTAMRLLAE